VWQEAAAGSWQVLNLSSCCSWAGLRACAGRRIIGSASKFCICYYCWLLRWWRMLCRTTVLAVVLAHPLTCLTCALLLLLLLLFSAAGQAQGWLNL
jgi:hypothetical protein